MTNLSPSTITLDGGKFINPADPARRCFTGRDLGEGYFTGRAIQSGSFSIVSHTVPEESAGDRETDATMEEMVPAEYGLSQVSTVPNEMNDFVLYNPSIRGNTGLILTG